MYQIYFYKKADGSEPVAAYIRSLKARHDKDSRVKLRKLQEYINVLSQSGLAIGEPYIKHLEGELWELRPTNDRYFFVAWTGDSFVFLHHFTKKSQKTPQREIDKAKRELADLKERGLNEDE